MASTETIVGSIRPGRLAPFEPDQFWQQAREPVFWLDSALRLIWVNRAWEKLTGYRADVVVGLVCHAHGAARAGDLSDLAASFYPPAEALSGKPTGTRSLIFHSNGEPSWHRLEFWPFCDDTGSLIGLMGFVRSIASPPSVADSPTHQLHVDLLEIKQRLHERYGFDSLVGVGPSHRRLLDQVRLAAASSTPVMIVGEPGTGKRQVARTIHQYGPGRQQPFIPFDCEALPADVLERELFDFDGQGLSGAASSTWADEQPKPRLSFPAGSTLLICEILTLHRDLQEKLAASLDSPVRLIATTAQDPESAFQSERLRSDLYFALTTQVITLKPLRSRRDELPALAQHLLERANQRDGRQRTGFSPEAITALMTYDWPGNVRELGRIIDQAHSVGEDSLVAADDLPASIRGHLGGGFCPPAKTSAIKPLDELLTEVERRLIETAFRQARGNKSRAAELLGISRPRLYRRIKELNLPDDDSVDDVPP